MGTWDSVKNIAGQAVDKYINPAYPYEMQAKADQAAYERYQQLAKEQQAKIDAATAQAIAATRTGYGKQKSVYDNYGNVDGYVTLPNGRTVSTAELDAYLANPQAATSAYNSARQKADAEWHSKKSAYDTDLAAYTKSQSDAKAAQAAQAAQKADVEIAQREQQRKDQQAYLSDPDKIFANVKNYGDWNETWTGSHDEDALGRLQDREERVLSSLSGLSPEMRQLVLSDPEVQRYMQGLERATATGGPDGYWGVNSMSDLLASRVQDIVSVARDKTAFNTYQSDPIIKQLLIDLQNATGDDGDYGRNSIRDKLHARTQAISSALGQPTSVNPDPTGTAIDAQPQPTAPDLSGYAGAADPGDEQAYIDSIMAGDSSLRAYDGLLGLSAGDAARLKADAGAGRIMENRYKSELSADAPTYIEDLYTQRQQGNGYDPYSQRLLEQGSSRINQQMAKRGAFNSGAALAAQGNFTAGVNADIYQQQAGLANQATSALMNRKNYLSNLAAQAQNVANSRVNAETALEGSQSDKTANYTMQGANLGTSLYGGSMNNAINAQAAAGGALATGAKAQQNLVTDIGKGVFTWATSGNNNSSSKSSSYDDTNPYEAVGD